MYSLKDAEPIIKYDILTCWLVERLENNEKINTDELERLLSSLDIGIEHKCQELKEEGNKFSDIAKEMFEKLEYAETKLTDEMIVKLYEKNIFGDRQSIYFYPEKSVRIIFHSSGKIYPPIITLEELQAINKQIEELGWGGNK